MAIYLCTFAVSSFLFLISTKTKRVLSLVLQSLGILLPCLIAAFRDETIGTDVTVYGIYVYRGTQHVSLFHAISAYSDNPVGFVTYAWLINLIHGSFQIYLFGIELLIILPAYLCFKFFAKNNAWICMLVYYFLFYGISLNLMKQMIAVSLGMLAFQMLYMKKNKHGIFLLILALSFHQTAFIAFFLYPVYRIYRNFINSSWLKKLTFYCVSTLCIFLIFVCIDSVVSFVSELKESYSFISQNEGNGDMMFSPIVYLLFIFLLHFSYTSKKHIKKSLDIATQDVFFYFEYLTVIGLIFLETQAFTLGLARFGYYFEAFLPLYAGMLLKKEKRSLTKAMTIMMILCICVLQTRSLLNGACEVYPYTSSILHIYE